MQNHFSDQIAKVAQGTASEHDNITVLRRVFSCDDMTAEFYLSTVDRIFKEEIAQNKFRIMGKHVDIDTISNVAIMTIEGGKMIFQHPDNAQLQLNFAGMCHKRISTSMSLMLPLWHLRRKNWRTNIRPKVIEFIDSHQ